MKLTYQEQLEIIKKIDTDEKGLILIKAIENIFKVEKIVERIAEKSDNNSTINNDKIVSYAIIDEFRTQNNYTFFERELKKICGFDEEHDISGDIIFQSTNEKGEIDISKLKEDLIHVVESTRS